MQERCRRSEDVLSNKGNNYMKSLILIRNIFRAIILISLVFRLFFIKNLSYSWNVSSYILLAIGLAGMIILEIIIYIYNKRN